jgi:hypothetical protein
MADPERNTTQTVSVTVELNDGTIEQIRDAVDAGDPADSRVHLDDMIHHHIDLDITAVDSDGHQVKKLIA